MQTSGRLDYDMTGIAALLRAETFRVPIYQRSYAWEELEVLDFKSWSVAPRG